MTSNYTILRSVREVLTTLLFFNVSTYQTQSEARVEHINNNDSCLFLCSKPLKVNMIVIGNDNVLLSSMTLTPRWVSKPQICLPEFKVKVVVSRITKVRIGVHSKHCRLEGSARCPSLECDECRSWVKMHWYFSSICAVRSSAAILYIRVNVLKRRFSTLHVRTLHIWKVAGKFFKALLRKDAVKLYWPLVMESNRRCLRDWFDQSNNMHFNEIEIDVSLQISENIFIQTSLSSMLSLKNCLYIWGFTCERNTIETQMCHKFKDSLSKNQMITFLPWSCFQWYVLWTNLTAMAFVMYKK